MRIPGQNILNKAFTAIAKQQLQYYAQIGRTLNNVGQYVTNYAPPAVIMGSFQPIPRAKYAYLGLDLQKSYFTLYISKNLVDLNRNISADLVAYQGLLYQCESDTEWFGIDGWTAIICVMIDQNIYASQLIGFNAYTAGNATENSYTNFSEGNFMPVTEAPIL